MAVVAAVAFVSCNNAAKEEKAENADSVEALVVETEEVVTIDSTAAPADTTAAAVNADSVPATK